MSPIDLSYLHDEETRVTDHATGGQKGAKATQIGALDPVALMELGRIAGMGANKYSAFNYLKGFDWSLAYNAMMRHANLFWAGEDRDVESSLPHIAHAAWMAMALLSFYLRGLGTDDRPPALTPLQDVIDKLNSPISISIEKAMELTGLEGFDWDHLNPDAHGVLHPDVEEVVPGVFEEAHPMWIHKGELPHQHSPLRCPDCTTIVPPLPAVSGEGV